MHNFMYSAKVQYMHSFCLGILSIPYISFHMWGQNKTVSPTLIVPDTASYIRG